MVGVGWGGKGVKERNHNRKHIAKAEKHEVQSKDNVNDRVVKYNMAGVGKELLN